MTIDVVASAPRTYEICCSEEGGDGMSDDGHAAGQHHGKGVTMVGFMMILALALPLLACDERLRDVAGPTPDLTPTFSSIQSQVFEATDSTGRAACTSCHTNVGRTPTAGLSLAGANAHSALVNGASSQKPGAVLVVPGDPENSYLIHKIEGRPGIVGERMPRTSGPFLTQGQILIIRRWIELGAQND